ncbi:MAG: Crp/Fnr family transcriptional regulator [Coriobacteriia bacterium]|nr:Crp/Fnr family transcriptional regulator [Coriobacteriia bacterium]
MKHSDFLYFLTSTNLFRGMQPSEIDTALSTLGAHKKTFKKGDHVLHAGEPTKTFGLVLSGSVTVENTDIWGNTTVLSHIEAGKLFAETYALAQDEPMLVNVLANEECKILFIQASKLYAAAESMEVWALRLVKNLLKISFNKNLMLSLRNFHTSPKTIRARIMSYLNSEAIKRGAKEFDIPFDRQQLAHYLNVERSALSKELGKMQKEGLITTKRSHCIIHKHARKH